LQGSLLFFKFTRTIDCFDNDSYLSVNYFDYGVFFYEIDCRAGRLIIAIAGKLGHHHEQIYTTHYIELAHENYIVPYGSLSSSRRRSITGGALAIVVLNLPIN
jgi:hypothetical protein